MAGVIVRFAFGAHQGMDIAPSAAKRGGARGKTAPRLKVHRERKTLEIGQCGSSEIKGACVFHSDGICGRRRRAALAGGLALLAITVVASTARGSPWAEVGDVQLRSDIQLLAAAGVIDQITTHWPLPWTGLLASLTRPDVLLGQPSNVTEAAERVLRRLHTQLDPGLRRASARVDIASTPSIVRDFGAMGRDNAEARVSAEMIFETTAIRISAGGELSGWNGGQGRLLPDGSYIAQRVGDAIVYAGYMTHWWGPGWISALSLSNNARPFPHLGVERIGTAPLANPWLSWIGAWQAEFLVGWLDGQRVDQNTLYNGLRFTFNPLPGLEIGLARTEEFCGRNHSCNPLTGYFNLQNDSNHPNQVNDQGNFDIHYSGMASGTAYEVYTQFMNEDTSPFVHSDTSHLFGGSTWLPVFGRTTRFTAEYTDSIATQNIFSFGNVAHGVAYNNSTYVDGMRYRGRTLGFSLDSDSRLASLQASWMGHGNWTYTLSYHRAWISTPQNVGGNILSAAPVTIDFGEARIGVPFFWGSVELAGRIQGDRPRPDRGFEASIEAALRFNEF